MSVPLHSQIKPGTVVSIVLKQDQRTGRQVQGAVSQVLTRGNHPHGVKVRLSDGRVGRVQKLAGNNNSSSQVPTQNKPFSATRRMADHNPWASDDSRPAGHGNQNLNPYAQQPQRAPSPGYPQQGYPQDQQHQYQQQPQSQQSAYQDYNSGPGYGSQPSYQSHNQSYNAPSGPPPGHAFDNPYEQQPTYNAWGDVSGNPPLPARHPARSTAPDLRRNSTDELLQQQEDRAEQMEHLQAYEATSNQSVDDRNRAQLEKEFPNIDGSLIAAIYGDTKDLSETREMLQELGRQ